MSKTYRPWNPNQQYMLPPSIHEWLPANDLVYFILDTVNELDISAITAKYEQEERGYQPYNPRMMVALLIYAYCRGIFSSRKIMQACVERLTFRVIVGEDIPNWRTISDFRKLHLIELQRLFVQVLRLCQQAGLVRLGHIALDGTKIKANASRHKAMSYGRMPSKQKVEEKWILFLDFELFIGGRKVAHEHRWLTVTMNRTKRRCLQIVERYREQWNERFGRNERRSGLFAVVTKQIGTVRINWSSPSQKNLFFYLT